MAEPPRFETIGPDSPIGRLANAISDQAFQLAARARLSRFELCVALANACGQILADAAAPAANPPSGIVMAKPGGRGLPREAALDRMDHLRVIMEAAYELRTIKGEG